MIRTIGLEGFKCFKEETRISLKPVTILYGKNGRGKSSVSQSLLLLGQSMKASNSLNHLVVNNGLISQGYFKELVNTERESDSFEFFLESTDGTTLSVGYRAMARFPLLGELYSQKINGVETLEFFSGSGDGSGSSESGSELSSRAISDISMLQNLKETIYVSAARKGLLSETDNGYPQGTVYVSPSGSNIINVIAEQSVDFIHELECNLSQVLGGASLSISYKAERIELGLNSIDRASTFRPVNVGFGYSYILPVIVAGMLAKNDSLVIIENPEAHLHPGAQSRLASFLIKRSVNKGFQLIIETHSDHVVNGLRISAKQKLINAKQVGILHFSHDSDVTTPVIQEILCDQEGNLSSYPDDFMDEWTKQLLELL